jgi:hypothetical protein
MARASVVEVLGRAEQVAAFTKRPVKRTLSESAPPDDLPPPSADAADF